MGLVHGALGTLEADEELAHLFLQPCASRRQHQAARPANEQLHAQFVLKVAHGTRERRLIDVDALGRPREVQLFRYCDEVAQVAQLNHPGYRPALAACRCRPHVTEPTHK